MVSTTKDGFNSNGGTSAAADIAQNFSEHSAEWREQAKVVGRDVQELGKMTKDIAAEAAHNLRDNAAAYYEDGVKHVKSFEESLEKQVRTHPLQSLLIAAGAGLLLGVILRK